jgi:hypothetical protein
VAGGVVTKEQRSRAFQGMGREVQKSLQVQIFLN